MAVPIFVRDGRFDSTPTFATSGRLYRRLCLFLRPLLHRFNGKTEQSHYMKNIAEMIGQVWNWARLDPSCPFL